MGRFIILLRTTEKIAVPEEGNDRDAQVVGTLQKYIAEDRIEYQGWHYDRGGDIDNGIDDGTAIIEDETFFEVRGEFDLEFAEPLTVLPQVQKALENNNAYISNLHEYGGDPFTKSVIEITIE
ncbi:hypothetical protein [Flavobacterium psychrotrophum]|uniref:hypothetical protein n=1 Tax=Flavobacterium psychrotrophum TaxID=2294119 RepID=UPI000E311D99|nr:hypothetical protein [Flavobacterium psychrotrophum]